MSADITAATALDTNIAKLETQLIDMRNQKETFCLDLWDMVKRVRSGVKASYGDDSPNETRSAGPHQRPQVTHPQACRLGNTQLSLTTEYKKTAHPNDGRAAILESCYPPGTISH